MKILGIFLLLVGALFAQQIDFNQVSSPSDGLPYLFKDFTRNFGLFVADIVSTDGGVQARLNYKKDLALEKAKELSLGNVQNIARLEIRENALNQDIDRAFSNAGTLQKTRILQKIVEHEQRMLLLRDRLPQQALIGFDRALGNLAVQKARFGVGGE